jgi:DnaJ-class molecular chaperone
MSDDHVTYEGVTYYVSKTLAPLTSHVETCPSCGGVGQMYGRNCRWCNGRGLLYTTLSGRSTTSAVRPKEPLMRHDKGVK